MHTFVGAHFGPCLHTFSPCLPLVPEIWFCVLTHHENGFFEVIDLFQIISLAPHIQLQKSHVPGQCFILKLSLLLAFPLLCFVKCNIYEKCIEYTFLNAVIKYPTGTTKWGRIYPGSITGIVHYGGEDMVAEVAWAIRIL